MFNRAHRCHDLSFHAKDIRLPLLIVDAQAVASRHEESLVVIHCGHLMVNAAAMSPTLRHHFSPQRRLIESHQIHECERS